MKDKNGVNNAVSPVIGVMLILIITLVIAGVIGVYINSISDTSAELQNNVLFDTTLNNDGLIISFITEPTGLELNKDYYIAISQPDDENEFVILDYVNQNVTGTYNNIPLSDVHSQIYYALSSIINGEHFIEFDNGYFYGLSTMGNKKQNVTSGWITKSGDQLNGLPYTVKLIKYDGTATYGTSSGHAEINEDKSVNKAWFKP